MSTHRSIVPMGLLVGVLAAGLSLSGCDNCPTDTGICATVDGSTCTQEGGSVYICPGEPVYLWWDSSEDVTEAEITSDAGPDVGTVAPTGTTTVYPTTTGDYEITATGKCTRTSSVHVHVVHDGDTVDIIVPVSLPDELWMLEIPKTACSEKIVVTSIEPDCGLSCFIHQPPIVGYDYLACGGTAMCNGKWALEKEDIDGHLHYLNTDLYRMDIPDWPFAGWWRFVPLASPYQLQGFGYFTLTIACR